MTDQAEPGSSRDDRPSDLRDAGALLAEANLTLDRLVALIAVAETLVAIGRLRDARASGQFSLHNFLLRAADEPDTSGEPGGRSLVVLMRAGVFQRHAWYLRVRWAAQGPPVLELPAPIDADWDWWPAVEEVRERLEQSGIWVRALGASYAEQCAVLRASLADARLVKIRR